MAFLLPMVARLMDHVVKPAALILGLSPLVSPAEARTDRPASFVDVGQTVPGVILDVRYFGADNFVGTRVDGYEAPRCFLTRPAAEALAQVAEDARRQGYGLKLFDCYRPARAVAHFARWAADLADESTKPAYYPDIAKSELFKEGYIAARSGHSRGSTLDLTLVHATSGAEVDMGTAFDLFSPRSWPGSEAVTAVQKANRTRLADLMKRHGFVPFAKEWWHFTLKDEPFPSTYFDFPIR
ncbi:M15 family metallopeptidase [Xanthobacter sp. KR7-225]|uniref:M15 family metallopeptidase n=1 Tax=Xanthobacter sp. KR7-225 TaxID=3156613 RepID=UPI0032B459D4